MPNRADSTEKENYRAFLSAFGVRGKTDPFPIAAPHEVDYWADNKEVLSKLIRAEGDALIFPSSRIHAFYGPLGGGKSFAVSYLGHPKTRKVFTKYLPPAYKGKDFLAFSVPASYPLKTGMLTSGVYVGVFERLFKEILEDRTILGDFRKAIEKTPGVVGEALRNAIDNIVMTLDSELNFANVEKSQGYKLLTLERSKIGSLKTQTDFVSAIKAVVDPLLAKYQRILVAIDELESLRQVSTSERLFFNDFLRRLHQEVETGLTLILIFSLQSFEDVQAVLQPAVIDRISESISFGYVKNKKDIVDYISECFEKGAGVNPLQVIDSDALEAIASDIRKDKREITFRDLNKQLHRIFASVLSQRKVGGPLKVTLDAYEATKKQIPVEDIIRDLS
jgi:hypothetical protein